MTHDRDCPCQQCSRMNASAIRDTLGWLALAIVAGLVAALVISTVSITHGMWP